MRAAGSRRRGRICQEEKGEVGRGKEASPGDNEVGLGGTGDCRGLPAGLPFNGERGGEGEPCAGGREANPLVMRPAAEQKCRPAKSSPAALQVTRFKGNRRSGQPGALLSGGTPTARLSSGRGGRALPLPDAPGWCWAACPQGWPSSAPGRRKRRK